MSITLYVHSVYRDGTIESKAYPYTDEGRALAWKEYETKRALLAATPYGERTKLFHVTQPIPLAQYEPPKGVLK